MDIYRSFLRQTMQNYMFGSLVAVLGVGGIFVSFTLQIPAREIGLIFVTLIISLITMMTLELIAFRRHIRPLRAVLTDPEPTLTDIRRAYAHAHRFPLLTVKRIFGPHLFGLGLPAMLITYAEIEMGLLSIPPSYIGIAVVGATLVAAMHAMLEFFMTSDAIQPVLLHLRNVALTKHGTSDISLDGKVLISIGQKFQFSVFLIGSLPLMLFFLAAQIRLYELKTTRLYESYWQWAAIILVIGIGYALLGARMMSRNVQQPIKELYELMGSVQTGNLDVKAPDLYSDEFSRLVFGFNHMITGLKERDRMNEKLISSYFGTLAAALDARDPYTAGHSQRVAEYSRTIGMLAGLNKETLETLYKSALLHDIGKIGVRDSVLLKDGRLNDDEFAQIKQHPVLGETILKQVEPAEAMAPFLSGVRSHHERYDGQGYPDRLAGAAIPLNGRIIAIADAFDAMTSDRPYRSGMPVDKALRILRDGAGTQWDPELTPLFVEHLCKLKDIEL